MIDHRPWLFDSTYEGHGYLDIAAVMSDIEINTGLDPRQCCFLIAADEDLGDLGVRYCSWPWYLVRHEDFYQNLEHLNLDWSNITITKCFISLARRPSRSRALMSRLLIDHFSKDQYMLSFGSQGFVDKDMRTMMQPYEAPQILDDVVDYNQQHRPPPRSFLNCLVNLVNETIDEYSITDRNSIFVTEKTFKCFAWRQIPIWNARPGIVASVRRLGFDVFDDLMDSHCYDHQLDNSLRRGMILDILQKFCFKYHQNLDSLRRQLWPRIQHNVDLLVGYISLHNTHRHKLTKYLLNKEQF